MRAIDLARLACGTQLALEASVSDFLCRTTMAVITLPDVNIDRVVAGA
jgi:hypothetical protein